MTREEALAAVIDALHELDIPYMVVGSLASNYYGIPRSTQDADLVIELGPVPIKAISDRLGAPFRLEPQMSFETVTGTTRYVLEARGAPFEIELFLITDDAYDRARLRRRRQATMANRAVFVSSAEDVIVTKLRWALRGGRSKDEEDARNVIAVQQDRIDWDYVNEWCQRHGTRQLLDKIRSSIPPV